MNLRLSILVLVSVASLAACSKKTPPPEAAAPAASVAAPTRAEPEATSVANAVQRITENLKRVHFNFDSDQLTDESKNALAENARLLVAYPTISIEVQGHCDDRGTTEYNLALGQRRADAISKYLVRSGVPTARVRTVSFGKERPLTPGDGEQIWAQNRRAEFRVTVAQGVAELHGSVE
jgi:peptidoglycan-associated lipoprotein